MRTSALAGRLLLYRATAYRDLARHVQDPFRRAKAQAYLDLFTPVAKAWSTEIGLSAASAGVQILGGAGFIEDSGMPQRLRDSRIAIIYEGTNGIHAIDLVMRKLPRDNARWIRALLDDVNTTVIRRSFTRSALKESYAALSDALTVLDRATEVLLHWSENAPNDALAGATAYLELLGLTLAGQLMIERAKRAEAANIELAGRAAMESEFFATEYVGRAKGLNRTILAGAVRLADLPAWESRPVIVEPSTRLPPKEPRIYHPGQ